MGPDRGIINGIGVEVMNNNSDFSKTVQSWDSKRHCRKTAKVLGRDRLFRYTKAIARSYLTGPFIFNCGPGQSYPVEPHLIHGEISNLIGGSIIDERPKNLGEVEHSVLGITVGKIMPWSSLGLELPAS
jgi:hypothetical protein